MWISISSYNGAKIGWSIKKSKDETDLVGLRHPARAGGAGREARTRMRRPIFYNQFYFALTVIDFAGEGGSDILAGSG